MAAYLKTIIYAAVIAAGLLYSTEASPQTNHANLSNLKGTIYHISSELVLKPGVYFRAIGMTNSGEPLVLECGKKEDAEKLRIQFPIGTRFVLQKVSVGKNGSLEACLDNMITE